MLTIIRLADGAMTMCEPYQIAQTLKAWTDQDATILEDLKSILHETAEILQNRWMSGDEAPNLQFAVGVRIEHLD
jgi:hypothetical protein